MRRLLPLLLLLGIAAARAATLTGAGPTGSIVDFPQAIEAYEAGEYARAARLLEQVLDTDPRCAPCAHLLGKSYGRLAEQAGWIEAISLARKTRDALEYAAELAPQDHEVLEDLIRYYRAAPGFLGGSNEKADHLERRLERAAGQSS